MESLGDILGRLPARKTSWNISENGAGYPEADTDNEEVCPICNGRGWIGRPVPVGHPDFGKALPCRCQETESLDKRTAILLRYSNLGLLGRISFDSTAPEGRLTDPDSRELFRAALESAKQFAEDPRGWLVFTGPGGSGKTHLAAAIGNRCIERRDPVFFMFVPDFLDHLRGTYSPDSAVSYDELFHQVRDARVMILDDLGSHSSTPWAQEKLFQVFNHRFNALLPTVITVRGPLQRLDEGVRTRVEAEGISTVHSLGRRKPELLQEVGGLEKDMLEQMTFENFKVDQNATKANPDPYKLKFAFDAASNFADAPEGWLLLTGPNGCGKTHLAVAIINERLKAGQPAFFAFVPALLEHLRSTLSPDSLTGYDEFFEQVKNTPLLMLDDLGSEVSTPWAEEKLYQIIVHRHNARLPTVITASLVSLEQWDEIKPRIHSRINDALVRRARIDAPDYRARHLSG